MDEGSYRTERIRGDGVDLDVAVAGEGPPVILLHGFPENRHSWRHQMPALAAAGFSAWAPNLRGYPPSGIPASRSGFHLRHLIRDVEAIVAATGHPRAHLVGHDWGGIISWAFAAQKPQLLDKLTILNAPHMRIYAQKVWRTSQLLRSWYVLLFQLPRLPEKLLRADDYRRLRQMFRVARGRGHPFSAHDIDIYIDTLSHPGALTAAIDYYRENMKPGAMELASGQVQAETLVIWGERDPALGVFLLEGLERHVPRLRIKRIPDAGHWVQNEAADEVNCLLLDFLGPAKPLQ